LVSSIALVAVAGVSFQTWSPDSAAMARVDEGARAAARSSLASSRPRSFGHLYSINEGLSFRQATAPASIGRNENRGFIYGGGAHGRWNVHGGLTLGLTVEATGNRFDTDRVEFLMLKTRADLGLTFHPANTATVAPYVSFGYHRWIRDLESVRQLVGQTQTWRRHYGQVGVEAAHLPSRALRAYVNAAVIAPLASRMKIDDLGRTCRVNFDGSPSAAGEIGVMYKRLLVSVFYEGQRFPQSRDRCFGAAQPESRADMFGLKTGFGF